MKNILVTGCSKGVGLSICTALLEDGYNVYGIARTHTDDYKLLQQKFEGKCHFLSYSLDDTQNIQSSIFKNWISNKIPIHAFINNAANAYDDIITNMAIEPLQKMFEINVFSPFLMTKYAVRNMIFNRVQGSIIHISSISVHTGYKGLAMYAGSKGALEAFSKNTAREWGEKGIRSNCIVAGFMDTDMSKSLTDDQKSRIYNRTSLKKATSVRCIADTVCYLISDKAISVTGQNIFVDSGTI